ncbi:MAG: SapC family protein [Erythrobacter sp.]
MASAPQPNLPLFYNDLMPLNSRDHKGWKAKNFADLSHLTKTHAIPLTIDEFVDAQRNYPVVFTAGDDPLPIALMGLNEGVNVFIDSENKLAAGNYLPAYARRYPFMLARLQEDSQDMSLCFDPSAGIVADQKEGNELFTDENGATEYTQQILDFCQKFEESGQRTKAFIEEMKKHDLFMEGEVAITQPENPDKPYVYRGFQMIDEQKLRDLDAETIKTMNSNGILSLILSHLFSLGLMRTVFLLQQEQGKGPEIQPAS